MNEPRQKVPSASDTDGGPEGASAEFRIVGIGASAGGLAAVSELLRHLPADLDMAFVVVMHLDPNHESSLAELLERVGEMPVRQATDGLELAPGQVYVIPPNCLLAADGNVLRLTPREESRRPPRPIDFFLRSLAQEHDGRGIGVILSGTGSDGTEGMRAILAAGGHTFAQDESAEHRAMPLSAVDAGCVSVVSDPEGIARELVRIGRHPSLWLVREPAAGSVDDNEADEILSALVRRLSSRSGIDFLHYKRNTVRRRIQRRIVLLGLERLDEYVSYFDEHPQEAETLCRDILIHVTSFFRDPEVFEALADAVFPAIVEGRAAGEPIRLWTPGCATGEESYSLAISLLEFLEQRSLAYPIKLFGTDVSEDAIAAARSGRYPERITAEVSPERLRRFFVHEEHGYAIVKTVRDLCVFARHDATRDPPFSNLDLISCRNLLIYLGPALQKRLMPTLHYALRDGGHLMLGTAESVGALGQLFEAVDERKSLYRRKRVPRRLILDLAGYGARGRAGTAALPVAAAASELDAQREADRVVLAKYGPPGVLVDEEMEILQFRGDTGAFLVPASGAPSNNLLRMARDGLLPQLRAGVEEARERDVPVRREGVRIRSEERVIHADLEVTPIRTPRTAERCYVILFETVPREDATAGARERPRTPAPARDAADGADQVAQLEHELVTTRDYLRANVERLEAANEELRAANEEILSGNEELHSTNEELQTAKEELQATNEELLTLNEELQHRNREAALLGDDLTNLLASVRIPIVMLGRDLRVRRFTPSAGQLLGLSASDVGRGLHDLELATAGTEIEGLVLEVLDTLAVIEREVRDEEGRWYVLTVRPYRTQEDKVDGAVVALADIDDLKRLAQGLEHARDFVQSVLMSVREPLLVLDAELSIAMSNRAFHEAFGTTPETLEGRRLGTGATASWVNPDLLDRLAEVRSGGGPFDDVARDVHIPGRGDRRLRLNARAVKGDGDGEGQVLLAIEDVTDREREREEKERVAARMQETQRLESLGVLAGGIAHDFNNILTSILGFAELLEIALPETSPLRSHCENIVASVERAAGLCREMLAYSGRGHFVVRRVDLSAQVRDSARLLEAMASKATVFDYRLDADLPLVEVDITQLRQVLANLVVNASEALGPQGGRVSIRTGSMSVDRAYLREACVGDVPEGDYVYLEVADDGEGMSAETQARIFDPFFTTKFTGRGLGLAAVLGIVRGHGGALRLESAPGKGATFRWLLPPAAGPAPEARALPARQEPSWTGEATVLVVDDERDIRRLLQEMLPEFGFRVEVAPDGTEGIDMLATLGDRVDVVLLDMTMPRMSGAEAFLELRKLRPDLPVVLMSGYDELEAVGAFPPSSLAGFLAKPFGPEEAAALLRHALGGGGTGDEETGGRRL